jgi:hypothetical protein
LRAEIVAAYAVAGRSFRTSRLECIESKTP